MESVVVSVKMPVSLKERIDALALKGMTSRNHWIVNTLKQRAFRGGCNGVK